MSDVDAERKCRLVLSRLLYIWSKLLKKARGKATKDSVIHRTSKLEAGSQVINSTFDKYSYCGYDCKIVNCKIGAFTSIADNVSIGGAQYPMDWVSTSPVFYSSRDSVKRKFSKYERPADLLTTIGNDVWIGESVLIKSGVTIGNGAVIGMGSVVTKDVEDYAIVAGNPARFIRKRFPDETIEALKRNPWWVIDEDRLETLAKHIKDPARFIGELQK